VLLQRLIMTKAIAGSFLQRHAHASHHQVVFCVLVAGCEVYLTQANGILTGLARESGVITAFLLMGALPENPDCP
jgi:hypothetical protein